MIIKLSGGHFHGEEVDINETCNSIVFVYRQNFRREGMSGSTVEEAHYDIDFKTATGKCTDAKEEEPGRSTGPKPEAPEVQGSN